jgi:pimeloyl-ACP methyl ester carboxylesterase
MKISPEGFLVVTLCSSVAACGDALDTDSNGRPTVNLDNERSEFVWLEATEGRIGGRAYVGADVDDEPILVVVLHGDLLEPDNSYHYGFARTLASQTANAVVVGLLRPGYRDERGNRSDGDPLTGTGDNYTLEVVAAIAQATEQLKARYGAGTAVLIGHSGGAALAALVLGLYPDVADGGLLVACPCDLPAWRDYMLSERGDPIWTQPHRGLSPIDYADRVSSTAIVELTVGDEDRVVEPEYSQRHAALLSARGVEARVAVLAGLGHNILLRPPVVAMASELMRKIRLAE